MAVSDLTTRRVIIGVLGMLFILPFFEIDAGIYGESTSLDTSGLEIVHEVAVASGVNSEAFDKSLEVFRTAVSSSANDNSSGILKGPPCPNFYISESNKVSLEDSHT